jgi:hypothetical protein
MKAAFASGKIRGFKIWPDGQRRASAPRAVAWAVLGKLPVRERSEGRNWVPPRRLESAYFPRPPSSARFGRAVEELWARGASAGSLGDFFSRYAQLMLRAAENSACILGRQGSSPSPCRRPGVGGGGGRGERLRPIGRDRHTRRGRLTIDAIPFMSRCGRGEGFRRCGAIGRSRPCGDR